MGNDMKEESLTLKDSVTLARKILDQLENSDGATNALLLAYDRDKETFQMLALNADVVEVRALLLGCVSALQAGLEEISKPRTVN